MELRLILPILLITLSASLTGAVDVALVPERSFAVQPDDGSFALLRMSGPDGRSPALTWGEPPPATRAFAIIAEDLDAPPGERVFWALWNLSPRARHLEEGLGPGARTVGGARQAVVANGSRGYRAPTFLAAARHRLRITLYALPADLDLPHDVDGETVARAAWPAAHAVTRWNAGGGWLRRDAPNAGPGDGVAGLRR